MLMHYNGKKVIVKYLKFYKPLASRIGIDYCNFCIVTTLYHDITKTFIVKTT